MSAAQSLILSVEGQQADRLGSRRQQIFDGRDGSIGRSQDCDWVLSAEGVSRLHALVRYLNGIYFIEDRSTNGMLLNGTPLRKGDPAVLKDGDRLQIDSFEVSVRLGSDGNTQENTQLVAGRPDLAVTPAAPVPAQAPAQNRDPLDLSLLLGPSRGEAPAETLGGEGLIPGADAPVPGASLDPLALFDAPPSYFDEPRPSTAPAPSWNHTPSAADCFRPPEVEAVRQSAPVLPEDWDVSSSQFAHVPKRAEPEPEPLPAPAANLDRPAPEFLPPESPPAAIDAPATVAPASLAVTAAPAVAEPPPDLTDMFHIAVDSMMDVLRARAELKNSFRMPATLIQRSENNPLKFAPNAEEAVKKLLAPPNGAFLSGTVALNDAADDIRNHQMAMLAGVRSAFESLLAHFDPARIEQETEGSARRLSLGHRPRHWERYKEQFELLAKNPDECFRRLFGDEFARAYEEQLARLKSLDVLPER
jgi:type VI secretion system protein ImpI